MQIDTNRFSILKRNKEFLTGTYTAPISFFWPRNTNLVLTVPLPVFSMLGNSSPGPARTQLELRKDREISTRDTVHITMNVVSLILECFTTPGAIIPYFRQEKS